MCRQAVKPPNTQCSGGITVSIRKEIEMYIEHVKSDGEGLICFKLSKEKTGTHMIYIFVLHTYIPTINSSRHLLNDENIFEVFII